MATTPKDLGNKSGINLEPIESAWRIPSPAANDFRSDTCTTATPAMLEAIKKTGLNEGWSCSGASGLEHKIAELTGRDAALFMVSSTMSNQIALRTHLQRPPYAILCDERSHIVHMEAGGIGSFHGALMTTLRPSNGLYMTLEDVKRSAIPQVSCDLCSCPTSIIHIENPLGGIVMPTDELRRICDWSHNHGIHVHLDGARLWEAVAAGAGRLDDICRLPDSVNLCLTKGIGASVGSVLVGSKDFIDHALWVRQSVGGSMRQPGFVAAAAEAAISETFGFNADGSGCRTLKRTQAWAAHLAAKWCQLGGKLIVPQGTNMIWLDLDEAGFDEQEWEARAAANGVKVRGKRIILHYQNSESSLNQLEKTIEQAFNDPTRAKGGDNVSMEGPKGSVSRLSVCMKEVYARRVS